MSKTAAAYLMKDRKLRPLIEKNGVQSLKKRHDYFNILVFSIANQQLSSASAQSIYNKLKRKCGRVTPRRILALRSAQMRAAGFSKPKIAYIRDLARRFERREINPKKFHSQSDEDILAELIRVKGIGRWTAEMFLMFSLAREDIFPADDLGIKKAIARVYGLRDVSQKNLDKFSMRWKPYRSYASLYLWKSTEIKPPEGW